MGARFELSPVSSNYAKTDANLQKFLDLVRNIQYGSVTLLIQDGKWIQIDINEKMRLRKTV